MLVLVITSTSNSILSYCLSALLDFSTFHRALAFKILYSDDSYLNHLNAHETYVETHDYFQSKLYQDEKGNY